MSIVVVKISKIQAHLNNYNIVTIYCFLKVLFNLAKSITRVNIRAKIVTQI